MNLKLTGVNSNVNSIPDRLVLIAKVTIDNNTVMYISKPKLVR